MNGKVCRLYEKEDYSTYSDGMYDAVCMLLWKQEPETSDAAINTEIEDTQEREIFCVENIAN